MGKIQNFKTYQNKVWIDTPEMIELISPVDLKAYARVPAMKPKDIDKSLKGNREAFKDWWKLNYMQRVKFMKDFAILMQKNAQDLANTIVQDVAKNYADALEEVNRSVEYINLTINAYIKMIENPLTFNSNDLAAYNLNKAVFIQEPFGVVLTISPFNYPLNLAIAKIVPALISGNTVIFKPATFGVVVGIKIAKLLDEINLPCGVFNLVTGKGRDIGDYLTQHKEIDVINFTGSTSVGKNIAKMVPCKPIILELGGKDFAIIRDDIKDIQDVAKQIIKGAFSYSGQRCTAIKRVFVTKQLKKKLEIALVEEVKKLSVGDPFLNSFIVPLIDINSAKYVQSLIDDAKKLGAEILIGGTSQDNLVQPTLITNVTDSMKVAWEEPFGPILPIIEVKNDDDAINWCNKSEYGLQGSIFTKDIDAAVHMALSLETGTVNINRSSARGPDILPFLGIKNSGFGVQGITEALKSMVHYKGIVIKK